MQQAQVDQNANETRQKVLELMYQRVAAQHDQIADFRAKLLAALPAVTALGVFATHYKNSGSFEPAAFGALGILGSLASIGLFVHELRGIAECYMLIAIGALLERKLTNGEDGDLRSSPFSSRLRWGFGRGVSRETAALIIYPVTIAAWVFVAARPMQERLWPSFVAALIVGVLAMVIGEACLLRDCRRVTEHVPDVGVMCKQKWRLRLH